MLSGIKKLTNIPRTIVQAEIVNNILRLRIALAAFLMSSRHIPKVFGALAVLFVVLSRADSKIVVFSKLGLLVISIIALLGNWFIEYHFLRKHMELRNLFLRLGSRNEKRRIST